MDWKNKRNLAVTAGLSAVLALSPVGGPVVTALAQDTSSVAMSAADRSTETFTVKYVHCDGTDDSTTVTYKPGNKLNTGNRNPKLKRQGYTFEGWYKDPTYSASSKVSVMSEVTGDMTLYAHWVKNPTVTFYNQVSYDNMEGVEAWKTDVPVYDDSYAKPTPSIPEGYDASVYVFDGWFTDPSLDDQYKFDDWNAGFTKDTVLYAKWRKLPTVTYYLSPESEEACYIVQVKNDMSPDDLRSSINKSAVTKALGQTIPAGYEIEGFYTDPAYEERFTSYANVDQDTVLYIKFNKQPTVTFDFNLEGAESTKETVNLFDYADAPSYDREGYQIEGWYTDEACTKPYDFSQPVTSDLTLYAKWEIKTFTVTFDGNADDVADTTAEVKWNEAVSEPAEPAREGYDFAGWYTDEACTTQYDFDAPVTSDLTLYAKWTEAEQPTDPENPGTDTENPGTDPEKPGTDAPVEATHTVTFDDCLPTTENPAVAVEDGSTVAKPADPVCEGYTFLGWYSDPELTQAWDFSSPVTEDMTLWAKWEKDDTDPATPSDPATTPSDPAEKNDGSESALPKTGDVTLAVSGIAAAGSALAGAGALLRRRR